jgi:hypothetical protein
MSYRLTLDCLEDSDNRTLGGSLHAIKVNGSLQATRAVAALVLRQWHRDPTDYPVRYPCTVVKGRLWYYSRGLSMRLDKLAH